MGAQTSKDALQFWAWHKVKSRLFCSAAVPDSLVAVLSL